MGALYEDVETFFGDIFAWYGRLVSRHPWGFVFVPLVISGLLAMGLFNLEYEDRLDVLYTPIGSQASKDGERLSQVFPDSTADNFYYHQQVSQPKYAEVIITRKDAREKNRSSSCADEDNVLSPVAQEEIWRLDNVIRNISVEQDGVHYKYEEVCAIRDGACAVDGQQQLLKNTSNGAFYSVSSDVISGRRHPVLSGVYGTDGSCSKALRLRYNLIRNSTMQKDLSIRWEEAFVSHIRNFESPIIAIGYRASKSLDIELREHVVDDIQFIVFSVLAMLVFATIIGSGVNCVTNHMTLAYAGVFAALLAIVSAFGCLSLLGLKFVNLCGVMPFLVLGKWYYALTVKDTCTVLLQNRFCDRF